MPEYCPSTYNLPFLWYFLCNLGSLQGRCVWQEQLPECMTPNSEAENAKFVDLMKRALYYYCLDDQFLQKEICEFEEVDTTFQRYFDQACISEQKRKSFQDISTSGAKLDPTAGVSVNKWEAGKTDQDSKSGGKHGKKNKQKSGGGTQSFSSGGGGTQSFNGGGGNQSFNGNSQKFGGN